MQDDQHVEEPVRRKAKVKNLVYDIVSTRNSKEEARKNISQLAQAVGKVSGGIKYHCTGHSNCEFYLKVVTSVVDTNKWVVYSSGSHSDTQAQMQGIDLSIKEEVDLLMNLKQKPNHQKRQEATSHSYGIN